MKRTLTLFLNVLFLLALLVPSGIAQVYIVHYWLDNSYNTYTYEYSHATSEGHVSCILCVPLSILHPLRRTTKNCEF